MSLIKHFTRNTVGRDIAVGDIHGHFTALKRELDRISFDPKVDRLFSVGDLVDRGPENLDVDVWLREGWFHAIQGNHEQLLIESHRQECRGNAAGVHFTNGGEWFYGLSSVEQGCYASMLADLPVAIEVETAGGIVGLVHADCPTPSWADFTDALRRNSALMPHLIDIAQWSRTRIKRKDEELVKDVRAVVVGHTPLEAPLLLGNVYHIDTAGWHKSGRFTLLDLATLEVL